MMLSIMSMIQDSFPELFTSQTRIHLCQTFLGTGPPKSWTRLWVAGLKIAPNQSEIIFRLL